MFKGYIDKKVQQSIQEILGDQIKDSVDRYARDLLRGGALIDDAVELVTVPGMEYVIFQSTPRSPTFIGGFIDLFGMDGMDTVEIKIEMRINKESKWRLWEKQTIKGIQEKPFFNFPEMLVIGGIKITFRHASGGTGKKFQHVWYRRGR